MSLPDSPKTLQALDRVIDVLRDIVGGTDYFYTIGSGVSKGIEASAAVTEYPFDMVYLGPEHDKPVYEMDGLVKRFPTIVIEGYIDAHGEDDATTAVTKHLRDVQKAINDDTKPGAGAGSLGVICHYARIGQSGMDYAQVSNAIVAMFSLVVELCVMGEWGEV